MNELKQVMNSRDASTEHGQLTPAIKGLKGSSEELKEPGFQIGRTRNKILWLPS